MEHRFGTVESAASCRSEVWAVVCVSVSSENVGDVAVDDGSVCVGNQAQIEVAW